MVVKWVKRLFIEVRKININLRWWNNFKLFKSLNSVPNKKDLGLVGQDFWNYISMRGISIIFYFGMLQEYIYIHHKNYLKTQYHGIASYFLWLCFNPLWINTMWSCDTRHHCYCIFFFFLKRSWNRIKLRVTRVWHHDMGWDFTLKFLQRIVVIWFRRQHF